MGIYVNPPGESNEQWLESHAEYLGDRYNCVPAWHLIPEGKAVVCLVDNGGFKAAAIVFDRTEYGRIVEDQDSRPKRWYLADIEQLKTVSALGGFRRG